MPVPLARGRVGKGSRSGETNEPILRMPPLPFPCRGSRQRLAKPLLSQLRRPPGAGGRPGADAGPPLPLPRPPAPLKELFQALSNGPLTLPGPHPLPPSTGFRPGDWAAPLVVQAPPREGFWGPPSVADRTAAGSRDASASEPFQLGRPRLLQPLRACFRPPFPGRRRQLPDAAFRGPSRWRAFRGPSRWRARRQQRARASQRRRAPGPVRAPADEPSRSPFRWERRGEPRHLLCHRLRHRRRQRNGETRHRASGSLPVRRAPPGEPSPASGLPRPRSRRE